MNREEYRSQDDGDRRTNVRIDRETFYPVSAVRDLFSLKFLNHLEKQGLIVIDGFCLGKDIIDTFLGNRDEKHSDPTLGLDKDPMPALGASKKMAKAAFADGNIQQQYLEC